jgi:GMP synthase (glutamine-hydrolysing)
MEYLLAMTTHDAIAVIDFGGQYAHLIATKVRQHHVLAEIRQPEDPIERFAGYRGIIISGSPSLASQGEDSVYTKEIYGLDIPILGLCFGHQEIAGHYGGRIIHGAPEWGRAELRITRDHPIFHGLGPVEQVWMSHFDTVEAVGPEFEELGYTLLAQGQREHHFAAIGSDRLRRYGFQFHPEVDDTVHGSTMLANFVLRICGCEPSWTMDSYLDEQIAGIRERVGDRSVFLLASGGIDSTVAAKLFGMALGPDRLHLLHIDNGLMRKDESRRVLQSYAELGLDSNLHFADASQEFLDALEGVTEPEHKRAIIGATFIEVFEREARRIGIDDCLLGQGTIYPDTIETGGTRRADIIKTHHNRVPIVERMIEQGRVIEPLADLYKVEVRELGTTLEVPDDVIWRHPFPGPGLGVRLLCSDGRPDVEGLDSAASAVTTIATRYGLEAIPLPIRSVGVKADLRSYEHPVVLTGATDWDTLNQAAGAIFKEVPGINRALWNLAPDPPSDVRPIAATVTRERLELLREADHIVMEGLRRHGLYHEIWQCATVLVPLEVNRSGRELVVVRPVLSERAMTARAARLPSQLIAELAEDILILSDVSGLCLDITTKPPGTIEWE